MRPCARQFPRCWRALPRGNSCRIAFRSRVGLVACSRLPPEIDPMDRLELTGGLRERWRRGQMEGSEQTNGQRQAPEGYDTWNAYWTAQGMPWRTAPEINEERQLYLAARRAVKPDIARGIFPFRDENG